MNKRLLDADPFSGIKTYHAYDWESDTTYIEEVQDCNPIIELNKAQLNHFPGGGRGMNEGFRRGVKAGWCKVATIPNTIIDKWRREYGLDVFQMERCEWTKKRVLALLNSREWMYLRTTEGRL